MQSHLYYRVFFVLNYTKHYKTIMFNIFKLFLNDISNFYQDLIQLKKIICTCIWISKSKRSLLSNKFLNLSSWIHSKNRTDVTSSSFLKHNWNFYQYAPVMNWVIITAFEETRLQENWKITLTSIHYSNWYAYIVSYTISRLTRYPWHIY